MKSFIIRSIVALFALVTLVAFRNTSNAALDSAGHSITGSNITGANVASYTVSLIFSGTLDTGDVVVVYLVSSWTTITNSYTGVWWETGTNINFDASSLTDWSITLSGQVLTASWVLVTGSDVTALITKDSTAPTGTISYSYTGLTSAPIIATLTLSESGTITNNGGSGVRSFTSNGSFTFTFQDTLGNTGSATATISNYIFLWWGVTYIPYPVATTNRVTIDYCPNGDLSPSKYDRVCWWAITYTGTAIPTKAKKVITVPVRTGSIVNSPYTQELNQAYLYAYSIGATTMPTVQTAYIKGHITRAQLAKMMSRYATQVLWKEPDTSKSCIFSDTSRQDNELEHYIKIACQLGIMNGDGPYFNPSSMVTRAEFGTVLSRILYGTMHEGGTPFYKAHLEALKNANIMTNINSDIVESRWNIMLMLMRASN